MTFTSEHITPDALVELLRNKMVNVSNSTRYSTRYDMEDRDLEVLVRSVHYYNNEADIEQLIQHLRESGLAQSAPA